MFQFYTEDYFKPGRAVVLMPYVSRVAFLLRWQERTRYFTPRSHGVTLFDLVNEGIYDAMPRTKRQPPKAAPARSAGRERSETPAMVWCNVRLSDDDIQYLEQQTATFDTLGAILLGIADEGRGFSVKPMDDGQSIMCAITGYAVDNTELPMGVSAFASNVRDAVIACVYKFTQSLGGEFTSGLGANPAEKPRFR